MSQQQSSVLSQQQTSVLSQQKTSILSQQKTSQQLAGGRQLSRLLLRLDRCLLLRQDRCLLLRHLSCLNRRHLSYLNSAPAWLLQAAGSDGPKSGQKALSICVFELATTLLVRERRRSMSSSIDFYNNFSLSSSAGSPPKRFIGLLKSRQNPSVQALFGECVHTGSNYHL